MRTALYVPGDRPDRLAKAFDRGADRLIVDLEDAVPLAAKERTRAEVAAWLRELPADRPADRPAVWVRINPGTIGHDDARAVVGPGLDGLCVAKTENPGEIEALDALLDELEPAADLEPLPVVPLLESAAAVLDAVAIGRAPRVVRLQLGEADLRADLGIEPGPDERELIWARSQVVAACAAAGLEPPLGPVSTNFRDLEALRESTLRLRRLGFRGRTCIHPAQIPVVDEVFAPSADELERARAVVTRYDAAVADGSGVCVDEDGRMVDEAVVRSARRTLAM